MFWSFRPTELPSLLVFLRLLDFNKYVPRNYSNYGKYSQDENDRRGPASKCRRRLIDGRCRRAAGYDHPHHLRHTRGCPRGHEWTQGRGAHVRQGVYGLHVPNRCKFFFFDRTEFR